MPQDFLCTSVYIDETVPGSSSEEQCGWSPTGGAQAYPDSCELRVNDTSDSEYCILHSSGDEKDPDRVRRALDQVRAQDSSIIADANLSSLSDGSELDFTNVRAYNVDFSGSNLSYATLTDATFEDSSFRNVNLSKVSGKGIELNNCDLTDADLGGADFACKQTDCSGSTFSGAKCNQTKFQRANLSYTDFSEARITNAHFQGTNLNGAEFVAATLRDTNMFWSNLSSCDFSQSIIEKCDFTLSNIEGAAFYDAVITETEFVDCELKDISLTGAHLTDSVDFGFRVSWEHYADWLASSEQQREAYGVPPGPHAEGKIGRDGMKAKMGDDWWKRDSTVPDESPKSSVQEFYADIDSYWIERLFSDYRAFARRVQINRFNQKIKSATDRILKIFGDSEKSKSSDSVDQAEAFEALQTAERVYAKIEATYSDSAWHDRRRDAGTRKNEVRRKQVDWNYPRQVLNKWLMGYGERPLYVLQIALIIGVFAALVLPLLGVKIEGTSIRWGLSNDFPESIGYHLALLRYSFYTLVGVTTRNVTPVGAGSFIEFVLTMAGRLLFAMFVYTLGRRAAS